MKKKSSYAHLVSDERWTWEQAYKKWFWIRFSLLLVALVLTFVVAYLYFVRLPQYESLAEQQSIPSPRIHKNASASTAPLADSSSWATYINRDKGFIFKYPDPLGTGATGSNLPITVSKHVTEIAIPSLRAKLFFATSSDDIYAYKDVVSTIQNTDGAAAVYEAVKINGKKVEENHAGKNAYVLFKHNGIFYAYVYSTEDPAIASKARTLLTTLSFTTE